jgi:ferredoxin
MAYVIAEPCIGTKHNSCVEVCPVDWHSSHPKRVPVTTRPTSCSSTPAECIDCDACLESCAVDAIFAEDRLPEEWAVYRARNAAHFAAS